MGQERLPLDIDHYSSTPAISIKSVISYTIDSPTSFMDLGIKFWSSFVQKTNKCIV